MCPENIHLFCSISLARARVGGGGHWPRVRFCSLSPGRPITRCGSQGAGPGEPYVSGCQCPECVARLATCLLPSWLSHSWLSSPSRVGSREGREGGCGGQRYLDIDVGRALPRVVVIQGHHPSRGHRVLPAASSVPLCSHHKEKKNAIMISKPAAAPIPRLSRWSQVACGQCG